MMRVSIANYSDKYDPKISVTKAYAADGVCLAIGCADIHLTLEQICELHCCIESYLLSLCPQQDKL